MSKREDWGNDIQPYDELEDVRPRHLEDDCWDDPENIHRYVRPNANFDPHIAEKIERYYP